MAEPAGPPVGEARSIFGRLGYAVSGEGTELRARRKWRTVHVRALATDAARTAALGDSVEADLRCFVTRREATGDLRERLERVETPFEWAIIGVGDGAPADYEVVRPDAP